MIIYVSSILYIIIPVRTGTKFYIYLKVIALSLSERLWKLDRIVYIVRQSTLPLSIGFRVRQNVIKVWFRVVARLFSEFVFLPALHCTKKTDNNRDLTESTSGYIRRHIYHVGLSFFAEPRSYAGIFHKAKRIF